MEKKFIKGLIPCLNIGFTALSREVEKNTTIKGQSLNFVRHRGFVATMQNKKNALPVIPCFFGTSASLYGIALVCYIAGVQKKRLYQRSHPLFEHRLPEHQPVP